MVSGKRSATPAICTNRPCWALQKQRSQTGCSDKKSGTLRPVRDLPKGKGRKRNNKPILPIQQLSELIPANTLSMAQTHVKKTEKNSDASVGPNEWAGRDRLAAHTFNQSSGTETQRITVHRHTHFRGHVSRLSYNKHTKKVAAICGDLVPDRVIDFVVMRSILLYNRRYRSRSDRNSQVRPRHRELSEEYGSTR